MLPVGFTCCGHSHRHDQEIGRLRATVRALAQDVDEAIKEAPDLSDALRKLFHRDLRRARQVMTESDGRYAAGKGAR